MPFRFLPLVLALAFAVTSQASAQENRLIRARTLCFQWVGGIKELHTPGKETDSMQKVPLFTSVMSLEFTMRATDGKGVFSLPGDGDPEHPFKPLPGAKLPSSDRVLFLFLPGKDPKNAPYQVVALADDSRSFPWGSVRMMNLYGKSVRFHMGEHSGKNAIGLNPGASRIIKQIRKLDEFNRYPVLAEFAAKDGFEKFYNNAWRAVDKKRDLVIVFPDPDDGTPRINHYEDAEPADLGDDESP